LHLRMNEMLPKKEKLLMNDLLTSYSLKLDVNRCF
jgi:hypothetical protein